jgi:hypothetical protein
VPPGHDVVVIVNEPPVEVTATFAVAVVEPAALVAVNVYVVVAVGLTLVDPVADVDANVPGVMAILLAPAVAQLSVLLDPEVTLVGLAVNELIVGLAAAVTVTVSVDVVEPTAFVAVNVYVVVAVGLTLVDPLADVDVNVPGVMAILLAPVAAQLSVLLAPESMLVGAAVKEVIAGGEDGPVGDFDDVMELQPASPKHANKISAIEHRYSPDARSSRELNPILQNELADSKGSPSAVRYEPILASTVFF